MSWKDRDIQRLKDYANKLGLTVYIRPYSKKTGEAEYVTESNIKLFTNSKTTKNDTILSLLHELGHHLAHIEKKIKYEGEDKALNLLNLGNITGDRSDIPKPYRKIILQIERDGIGYMSKIHRRLKLEIPFWVVKHQQEIDLYEYISLYRKGSFATTDEMKEIKSKKEAYKAKYARKK